MGRRVPHWDKLGPDLRARGAARLMETFAGFAEHADTQLGRFVDEMDELGVFDDTLIST